MSLVNFYKLIKQDKRLNPGFERHHLELPFRALICTASGGGKTNLTMNILLELTKTLHKVIIITKAAEPLYDLMKSKLKDQVEIIYMSERSATMPTIAAMPKDQNGMIIYDDMVLDQSKEIGEMFIRGRKLGYSSIFISQSFFGTGKLIRQNVSYVWLGRGISKRDLRLILSEYALSMTRDELEQLYARVTNQPMQFLMLDLVKRQARMNITDVLCDL
jgi:hypothetical protein